MAGLNLRRSDWIVRVRAIDAKMTVSLHSHRFFEPQLPGFSTLNLTSVCYLIDHPTFKRRILFDCGARTDFENYSPAVKSRLNAITKGLKIEANVHDVLPAAGIELDSIDSIVWSHWHWDHVGAAEAFPTSVGIVVGPGFEENFTPGYPTVQDAPILDADLRGRNIHEISFSYDFLIGSYPAHDFFGDGSFYLLDTPGHAIGHMCGLARTTSDTFIFMGGDICHYAGVFRPSLHLPLPDPVPADQLDAYFPSPCPCSIFTDDHPLVDPQSRLASRSPFFDVTSAQPSSYADRDVAMGSIGALQQFDGDENVLVCIAHDPGLLEVLPMLNDDASVDLNDWRQRGWKEKLRWRWLNELPRKGEPGRPMLVEGVWKDGREIEDADFEKLEATRS